MPSWWSWAAEMCLLPWIGPALALLTGSGDDPLAMLLGITFWPILYVFWGIRQTRRREKGVLDANPMPFVPRALLTYSVLAKGSLVLYFLTMVLTAVMVQVAGEKAAGEPYELWPLGTIIAVVFFVYVSINAFAFRRLRQAVRFVNLMLSTGERTGEQA